MNTADKSILLIEPEKELARQLSAALSHEGYGVTSAFSGREAIVSPDNLPNLIILNPQLPDMNGLDFLRALKHKQAMSDVSVFILSTKETEIDEIISLEVGADDYITKPVQISRLIARIRALFRRQDQQRIQPDKEDEVITIDDLSILIPQYTAVCGQKSIAFSKKEFEILVHLVKNRGLVLTRQRMFASYLGAFRTAQQTVP